MRLEVLIRKLELLQEQHGGHVDVWIALPRGWPMVAPVSDVRYLDAADEPPDVVRCVVWIAGE